MRYQYLAAAALTVASVAALPNIRKRDEKTWDPNGNIKLTCRSHHDTTERCSN